MFLSKKAVFAAAATLLSTVANTQGQFPSAVAPEDSAVIKLTGENFAAFIAGHNLVLAEFYVPWDYHSKLLIQEFVATANELQQHDISLVQIDCEADELLCSQLEINYYPTLKIFKNQKIVKAPTYTGTKSAETLVPFMIAQAVSPINVVDNEEDFEKYLTQDRSIPLLADFGAPGLNETFYEMATDSYDKYVFVSYPTKNSSHGLMLFPAPVQVEETSEEIARENEGLPEGQTVMKMIIPEPIPYVGDLDKIIDNKDEFIKWTKVSLLPFFQDCKIADFNKYMETKMPLAYLFYTDKNDLVKYTDFFTELGQKYRGEVNFIALDANTYSNHVKHLSLKQQYPLFAIHNVTNNMKYSLPQLSDEEYLDLKGSLELDEDKIVELIDAFVNKTAVPMQRSEPVPKSQDSNVYKLVGDTHDAIVFDKSKDVLVKYYAPWCSHSKRLAPIFEELADIYASDESTKDKLLLAEVDATANDIIHYPVEGYPTVVLFPAGEDTQPIMFKDSRTLEKLVEFVRNNGTYHIDADAIRGIEHTDTTSEGSVDITEHDEL
ncbi:hypothetical protein NCAS_0A00320 [Naumovozyma castellii]|uniref:protein disulfide-isomerase n=1 Tax=Naumovozyma castellii TaxID=27288 RepID=G0V556_NAUCA|nr:hypothetical protein NCAS_0A00320 [Naumovozyma castellii CBS 4309]CCC66592.1 hypothetical protein NCAS_0A00320 [Naumovozyma castellii CBS 4309]